MKMRADGVHSGYEDDMIAFGFQKKNLAGDLKTQIAKLKSEAIPEIKTGYDASKAVIALVTATQAEVAPAAIVKEWVKLIGTPAKAKAAAMWDRVRRSHRHLHGARHPVPHRGLAGGVGCGQTATPPPAPAAC